MVIGNIKTDIKLSEWGNKRKLFIKYHDKLTYLSFFESIFIIRIQFFTKVLKNPRAEYAKMMA